MRIMRFLHPSEPGEPAEKPPVPDSAPPGDKPPETKPPEEETDEGSDLFGLDDDGETDEAPPAKEPEKADAKPEGDDPPPAKEEPDEEDPGKADDDPPQDQPPAQPSPKQFFAHVTKIAKEEVEAQFGEKFDEFNPAHVVALQSISRDIIDDYRHSQQVKEKARQADREASKIITSEALKKFAAEQFENLPYREAMKLRRAESEGNFQPILDFFKDCSKRFEEKTNTRKKADAKVAEVKGRRASPPPPPLEGAGAGTSGTDSERDDDTLSLFGFGG